MTDLERKESGNNLERIWKESAACEFSSLFISFCSREEMLTMLKTCLVRQGLEEDGDEGVKDLVEMTLKKMDDDKDGRVSFADFKTTVKNDPLMLEAFGPCLPSNKAGENFICGFLENS